MEPTTRVREMDGTPYTPEKVDGTEFLREWKRLNPQEYDHILEHQELERNHQQQRGDEQFQTEAKTEQENVQEARAEDKAP